MSAGLLLNTMDNNKKELIYQDLKDIYLIYL